MNTQSLQHIVTPLVVAIAFVALCIFIAADGAMRPVVPCDSVVSDIDYGVLNGWVGFAVNVVVMALSAFLLARLNSIFPLLKEHSFIALMFFLLLQILSPGLVQQFAPANVAALLLFGCIFILYMCYQSGDAPGPTFLIALVLASASMLYARAIFFLPLFLLGMHQMKAFSVRTLPAAIIGMVTPYWIVWGMGWVPTFNPRALLVTPQLIEIDIAIVPVVLTMLLGAYTGINNLPVAFTEKIQTRAFNGFINLLSIYTSLLILIDLPHYEQYLPILNMGVAIQSAYYFTSHRGKGYTILFYSLVALLIAAHVWIFWVN